MNNVRFQYGRVLKRCTSDINLNVFSRQLSGWNIIRQLDARDIGVLACRTCLLASDRAETNGSKRIRLTRSWYGEDTNGTTHEDQTRSSIYQLLVLEVGWVTSPG